MSALRWGFGTRLAGQILAWSMSIYVIRLLSPEDYGLNAIAMLFVGFLMLLNEMGLSAVLIQRTELEDKVIRQIFGLIVLVNAFLFVALFFGSYFIAAIFEEPRLIMIIKVLSLHFLISSLEVVPTSLLIRDFKLKKKEIIYVVASLSGGVLTLIMAFMGYGVWSLIIGFIASAALRTCIINYLSPKIWIPSFSFENMKSNISFGGFVLLERGMWSLYTQADILILGKMVTKEMLGFYSVAMHLSSLIMHKTGAILYNVAFPTFSRLQGSPDKISYFFLKAMRVMAFLVFPVFIGMSAVANDLVVVLLGEKWRITGPILTILCLVMPMRVFSNLLPPALQGAHQPRKSTVNVLIAFILMPLSFMMGVQWGLIGVSFAWLIMFPIVFFIMIYRSENILGITMSSFLESIMQPFFCSMLMYAILMFSNHFILTSFDELSRLLIQILLGLLIYLVLLKTILRERFKEVIEVLKK